MAGWDPAIPAAAARIPPIDRWLALRVGRNLTLQTIALIPLPLIRSPAVPFFSSNTRRRAVQKAQSLLRAASAGTLVCCLNLAISSTAFADPTQQAPRSELEESHIAEALAHYGWQEELHPEGKVIEEVAIYVAEVLDDRDPIPNFFNVFHVRTQDWVVQQEVLSRVGESWHLQRVLETERNLRAIRQHSLANVVAVQGSRPGTIRLLVVVKDVWSLRINSNFQLGSTGGLKSLLINPTEENLLGTRASLGLLFQLLQDQYAVGATLLYPRMFGSPFEVGMSGGIHMGRESGEGEGSFGSFYFGLPLYSRESKWSYFSIMDWDLYTYRSFDGADLELIPYDSPDGVELVPLVYDAELIGGDYYGIRSFGLAHKKNLTFGISVDHRRYRMPEYEDLSAEALDSFEQEWLPVSDTLISPYVKLEVFETRFYRTLNLESLGIQEDWRLGYDVATTMFTGAQALGSSRNQVGASISAGYTSVIAGGFIRVGASNHVVVANDNQNEGFFSTQGRVISPHMGIGRLHLDGYLGYRYQNYRNLNGFSLGGDNRLRGYAPGQTAGRGTSIVAANAEFRTDSIDILSAQVGLAAFYDLGDASDEFSDIELLQGAGAGVRVLFPQADRTVLRLDWAFPLSYGAAAWPGAVFLTFGQAFPMPASAGGGSPFL